MADLERNIWQEVSTLSVSELEKAIRNLVDDLELARDKEKRTKISRMILVADYLRKRQELKILDRDEYENIMQQLGIKNGNTMRAYLQELRDKAKYS